LALTPDHRYTVNEKQELLDLVARARVLCPQRSLREILTDLGLSPATFYAWQQRAARGQLDNHLIVPTSTRLPATPAEVERVVRYAEAHPLLGYKRLTWSLIDENVAFLRPWMVYAILAEHHLLGRRAEAVQALERPAEPTAPDQRWHTDLMNLQINGRWVYLIDFLDSYSRYLVYWEILLTAKADAVLLAGQRAIETLNDIRTLGQPEIVHDNGPQFISWEWRRFIRDSQATDIPTLAHHPQSNGRVERFHRTTQEEALPGKRSTDLYQARETMCAWQHYYNHERPHSAIRYLRPIDYYRGNPAQRLAEREEKLFRGAIERAAYWQNRGG
jgi:putative transposase